MGVTEVVKQALTIKWVVKRVVKVEGGRQDLDLRERAGHQTGALTIKRVVKRVVKQVVKPVVKQGVGRVEGGRQDLHLLLGEEVRGWGLGFVA